MVILIFELRFDLVTYYLTCAFEWRSNLKIDRVMVILIFELRFDLVTYLFDLWPHNNDISMYGAIFHMWTRIGDD